MCLKLIVVIDEISSELKRMLAAWGKSQNVKVMELLECKFVLKYPFRLLIIIL
jgi:hypothetical protein